MLYVGLKLDCTGRREVFRAEIEPTRETHGAQYTAVIGPFRTKRGAEFMRDYGRGNPHCLTVADAERLARKNRAEIIAPEHEPFRNGPDTNF